MSQQPRSLSRSIYCRGCQVAKALPHCTYCHEDDHLKSSCPRLEKAVCQGPCCHTLPLRCFPDWLVKKKQAAANPKDVKLICKRCRQDVKAAASAAPSQQPTTQAASSKSSRKVYDDDGGDDNFKNSSSSDYDDDDDQDFYEEEEEYFEEEEEEETVEEEAPSKN